MLRNPSCTDYMHFTARNPSAAHVFHAMNDMYLDDKLADGSLKKAEFGDGHWELPAATFP